MTSRSQRLTPSYRDPRGASRIKSIGIAQLPYALLHLASMAIRTVSGAPFIACLQPPTVVPTTSGNLTARVTMKIRNIIGSSALFLIALAVALLASELILRLQNSSMRNYNIEMWRYAKELKTPSAVPELGHEHLRNASAVLQSVEFGSTSSAFEAAL